MNEIAERMRKHVKDRGGPTLNGVWQLMLDAADEIDRLEADVLEMGNYIDNIEEGVQSSQL